MPKVTVFSTTTCKYCKQVKDYLTANHVEYEEVLLDQQPDRIQESVGISGQRGVPVTKIVKDDGSAVAVLGWDQEQLAAQLGLNPATASA